MEVPNPLQNCGDSSRNPYPKSPNAQIQVPETRIRIRGIETLNTIFSGNESENCVPLRSYP